MFEIRMKAKRKEEIKFYLFQALFPKYLSFLNFCEVHTVNGTTEKIIPEAKVSEKKALFEAWFLKKSSQKIHQV